MTKVNNFDQLAKTETRRIALSIAEAGLKAIDTESVVKRAVRVEGNKFFVNEREFDLASVNNIYVVGVGKCSLEAGAALENILGNRVAGGVIVDVREGALKKIKTYQGTHPLPTERNMDATKQIIELLGSCEENDLVIFIISGGGSTLLCQPANHTCLEETKIFKCLTDAGATIRELNTVRKHTSLARGGFLAEYAYPARAVALIFSDIPGNDLGFVASGPTIKDMTTVADAEKIIAKYDPKNKCGLAGVTLIETPKEDKYFEKVANVMLVSNEVALLAMADESRRLGFLPQIVTAAMNGEARNIGKEIAGELAKNKAKTVLLYGGETTVTVDNPNGKGGRNQELALSALRFVSGDQIIVSVASDGRDNSDFGGAICDKITMEKAKELNLDPQAFLNRNLSYEFFAKTGDYLMLGDTGSNVSDLIIALKK